MRPIQWQLKRNWKVPESLEKVIPIPKSLSPQGLPLQSGILSNLYRCIKRRVGRLLRRAHYKGNLLPPRKQVALSLLWEDLDIHAFPPVAILGKVLEKFQDYLCKRIILIAPGWPTMPWFWDLMTMSGQILLYLPNLLTQPFSQIPHRILPNLNLNVLLLDPQLSMSKVSLRQWQHEMKLLRVSTKSVYEAKWTIFTK